MNIDLQAREITPLRNTFARVAAYHGDKVASRYQEATLGVQPTANFHYRPTWEPEFELFDTGRTAVKLADWYVLRDPRQYYYANWTMARARQQEAMEANYQFVESRGLGCQHEQLHHLLARLWHGVHGTSHVPRHGCAGCGAVPHPPGPGAGRARCAGGGQEHLAARPALAGAAPPG